jgi:putative membrane protein
VNRFALVAAVMTLFVPSMLRADGGRVTPDTWRQAWNWDPLVLLTLVTLALLYLRGLARLWAKVGVGGKVGRWQAMSFFIALFIIFIALLSPVDSLSEELSSVHMVQHMLLTIAAAPLFILGSPMFVFAWALPEWHRGWGSRLMAFAFRLPQEPMLWRPLFVWALFAATMWAWHHPVLYQAALRDPLLHDAQHVSFFVVACLFWRLAVDPLSRNRLPPLVAIPYLFATSLHATALGAFLALSPQAWYDDYAARTSAWGLTPLQDQQIAGLIMWAPACLVYPAAAAALFGIWLASATETTLRRTERVA